MKDLTSKMEIYPPGQIEPVPEPETPRQRVMRMAESAGLVLSGVAAFAAELLPIVLSLM
jgi:hypothetical protein